MQIWGSDMKLFKVLAMGGLMAAGAVDAAQLNRLDYGGGIYYRASGAGYEFTIGCERSGVVDFRIDAHAIPSAAQTPGAVITLRFVDYNGGVADLRASVIYGADQGDEYLIGQLPLDADFSLATENAISLRASDANAEIIFADGMQGFDDVLFFMEEGCY